MSLLALLGGAFSCIKEELPDAADEGRLDTDGYSLGITITLDNALNTRATSWSDSGDGDYDNYIDTRNKLRVFFFDKNGQFIFEATDRTVMNRPGSKKGEEWFVHVPVNYIVDSSGNAYDVEALKEQLKSNDFKVAVLANWDAGEPRWGYYNSILCTDATRKAVKNINDLHFLTNDSNYNSTSDDLPKASVYGFIWGAGQTNSTDGKLGVKTQWVESRSPEKSISDRTTAETWIKDNWDPSDDAGNYPPYTDLWMYWNFDYNSSTNYPSTFASEWQARNKADFSSWLKTGNLEAKQDANKNPVYYEVRDANGNWKDAGEFKVGGSENTYYEYNETEKRYGIRLEAISNTKKTKDDGTETYEDSRANVQSVIKFRYPATGVMRVKWGSSDGNNAKITIEKRNKENQGVYQENKNPSGSSASMNTYEWKISVTEDSEYISIYCTTGKAIIYEIEYVADKYLYDTDRRGILPSASHPIPMYGVQNFGALTNWKPGSTFDLSHDDRKEYGEDENGNHEEYEVKHISLIRSVAKVELYLPSTYNGKEPTQVYMRSMNRTSRNEPMDVETPTDELWSDTDDKLNEDTAGPCEWYTIQQHGPFITVTNGKKDESSDENITTEYQNRLAWFYGSWLSTQWLEGGTKGWTFGKTADKKETNPSKYKTSSSEKYPRLFNSSIERSDFAEMIEVKSDRTNYRKFILYMPDKNIDDPTTVGVLNSVNKVAHIEYRYDNSVNVDDDFCYRVYFTNYGSSGYKPNTTIGGIDRDDFDNNDNYEMRRGNIEKHWPVMRNHVYTFVVNATTSSTRNGEEAAPTITSTVTTWSGKPVLE